LPRGPVVAAGRKRGAPPRRRHADRRGELTDPQVAVAALDAVAQRIGRDCLDREADAEPGQAARYAERDLAVVGPGLVDDDREREVRQAGGRERTAVGTGGAPHGERLLRVAGL